MKWTTKNTEPASGWWVGGNSNHHVRECPRCYGSGMTRINQDGENDPGANQMCQLCHGNGNIIVEE
jgi:DnaJ-class molecular chaperone